MRRTPSLSQNSFISMYTQGMKAEERESHLGSLNVSHVIPQQLRELQLLVRCNSSFHFLQGAQTLASYHNLFTKQDKHWQSCLGSLQTE